MAIARSKAAVPAGPVDRHAVRLFRQRYAKELDPSYLMLSEGEGQIISVGTSFTDGIGGRHRLGRLLPFIDDQSELPPPHQPSLDFPDRDRRIDWSVLTLLEEECPTAYALFGGQRLIPFASLHHGRHHPDELRLGEAKANLLAFDYQAQTDRPAIVVWLAQAALQAYADWGAALRDAGWNEPVPYSSFIVPVAATFDDFAAHLACPPPLAGVGRDELGG